MGRTVQMMFKNPKGKLLMPTDAEIFVEYQDESGFAIYIDSSDVLVLNSFPRYVVFKYDSSGEPQVAFATNNWDDMDTFWIQGRFEL